MSRVHLSALEQRAMRILDAVRAGVPMSMRDINWALAMTGDLAVQR